MPAFHGTLLRRMAAMAKRITLPRLSPTHTRARIDEWCVRDGDLVEAYTIVLKVTPSSDLTTVQMTKEDNEEPLPPLQMSIDTQDEGVVRNLRTDLVGTWVDVDTELGLIVEEEEEVGDYKIDGNWLWQAYNE